MTFSTVPDAPFTTFETSLPARPFSQFTSSRTTGRARASQCGEKLVMPVTLVGQNGLEFSENRQIKITGCKSSRPKVEIRSIRPHDRSLVLTVATSQRGALRISGSGLKTLTKKGFSAGKHKLTVQYTKAGRRAFQLSHTTGITVGLAVGKQKVSKHRTVRL